MHRRVRKLIAPVIITALLVVYLLTILTQGVALAGLLRDKAVIIVVVVALIGVSLHVLQERVKEIRSGEEDDLGKY